MRKTPITPMASAADTRSFFHADFLIFLLIFVIAFLVRLGFVQQVRDCPQFDHLIVDARAYNEWADEIAAGNWLGDRVFYQAPLYPYFLAVLKSLGLGIGAIRMVQICLGAITCAVIFLAGRSLFDRASGATAGFMLALYPPAIFFDAIIQKTGIGSLIMALLLLALLSLRARPGTWRAGIAGALLGLLMLTREETILLVPVLACWAFFQQTSKRSGVGKTAAGLGHAAAFLLGLSLPLAPVAIRNYRVGGEFVLTTAQAGPNFYIGNNARATGMYAPLRAGRSDTRLERLDAVELAEQASGRRLSASEVSRYWLGRAWEFISTQPARWLSLLARKAALLVNAYEIPDAENQYFYEQFAPGFRVLSAVWHFGVLVPLAIAGCVFARRSHLPAGTLYILIGTLAGGVVLFYVFGRYRFTLVPPLMLLAGLAVMQIARAARDRRLRSLAAPVAAGLIAGVAANWPLFSREHFFAESYSNAGAAIAAAGDDRRAVELFSKALQFNPALPDTIANLAMSRARLHGVADAIPLLGDALKLRPDDPRLHMFMGTALAETGDLKRAAEYLDRAVSLAPGDLDSRVNYRAVLAQLGRRAEAIEQLRAITRLRPDDAGVHAELAWALATCPDGTVRDGPAAIASAEKAVALGGSNNPELLDILACAYAQAGRFDDAIRTANVALEKARARSPAELVSRIERHLEYFRNGSAVPPQ